MITENTTATTTIRADAAEIPEEKRAREIEEQLRSTDKIKADNAATGEMLDKVLSRLDAVCTRMDAMDEEKKTDAKKKADAEEATAAEAKRKAATPGDALDDDDAGELLTEEERVARKPGEAEPVRADEIDRRRNSKLLETQARADAVYMQHGLQAPRAIAGERVGAYRKRLLRQFQRFSPAWKSVDLSRIADRGTLDVAEAAIYADAIQEAQHPTDIPVGTLRPVVRKLETGHTVTEFYGSPSAWMSKFSGPVSQRVKRFNVPNTTNALV